MRIRKKNMSMINRLSTNNKVNIITGMKKTLRRTTIGNIKKRTKNIPTIVIGTSTTITGTSTTTATGSTPLIVGSTTTTRSKTH